MKECRRAEHLSQAWAAWIRIPTGNSEGSMGLMAAHASEPCGFQEIGDASKSPLGGKKTTSSFSNTPQEKASLSGLSCAQPLHTPVPASTLAELWHPGDGTVSPHGASATSSLTGHLFIQRALKILTKDLGKTGSKGSCGEALEGMWIFRE